MQDGGSYQITANSAGNVRLGATVAEAQGAMPGFQFKRTSDGEGVALIEVSKGDDTHMILYAGEEDSEAAIDGSAKIEMIFVTGRKYATSEGVSPGMKVSDAESKLGKVQQIMMSEIEAREYADFERGSGFQYRLLSENGSAGRYPEGSMRTQKYDAGAYIHSIQVSEPYGGPMDGSNSVMDLIVKAVGDFSEMFTRTIEIKADTPDGTSEITVVVTDDGFLDDSVRGQRTTLKLVLDAAGLWQIKSTSEAWRCREGRGHTDFQPKPCI
ncbi:MAG: hypothetical protein DWQ47_06930 [Acidobacteria bacterium]|nr:MAG: hypothetical protein DWQ32_15030 [Acidobacteriota bacterium]REJ99340.1 MAG: hypothetical protein DWQ38_14945 [Acidobacteriota bacterium]REK15638.1 MAG: hypothetical protein DWQ43_05565 [Acidobacteriota bacterium]REK43621.1 MAG: hypothetical protein DWQ47_06930 [Acidobacteriota bacterium]